MESLPVKIFDPNKLLCVNREFVLLNWCIIFWGVKFPGDIISVNGFINQIRTGTGDRPTTPRFVITLITPLAPRIPNNARGPAVLRHQFYQLHSH